LRTVTGLSGKQVEIGISDAESTAVGVEGSGVVRRVARIGPVPAGQATTGLPTTGLTGSGPAF
jgi:hypothetical protein